MSGSQVINPDKTIFDSDGKILCEEWYQNGELHNPNGPARIMYDNDGNVRTKEWYYEGKLHMDEAPAVIEYNASGEFQNKKWFRNGIFQRDEGPLSESKIDSYMEAGESMVSFEFYNFEELIQTEPTRIVYDHKCNVVSEEWLVFDECIRYVYVSYKGCKVFCCSAIEGVRNSITIFKYDRNGNLVFQEHLLNDKRHNEIGPAWIQYKDGPCEEWYQYDMLHRDSGPALIKYDQEGKVVLEEWYKNGKLHNSTGDYFRVHYSNDFKEVSYDWGTEKYHKDVLVKKEFQIGIDRFRIVEYSQSLIIRETIRFQSLLHDDKVPALIEYKNGKKVIEEWYFNGKLHNSSGPARVTIDSKAWYKHGKLHNSSGPALIEKEKKEWYLDGIKLDSTFLFYLKFKNWYFCY